MATISPHTTRATGTILTAVIYNGDHANHILNATNLNNAKIEGPGPVADNAFVLFDGTSGFMVKSGGLTLPNSQLADMVQATIKGRAAGAGTGDPQDLTAIQVLEILGFAGNDPFTKVLLHFDGADASTTFPDTNFGGSAHTWTAAGNAQIDTAQSKFGGASLLLDGTGDWLTTPDNADFVLGTQNFTVDLWFNCNKAGGSDADLGGQTDGIGAPWANTSFFCDRDAGNRMRLFVSDGTNLTAIQGTTQFTNLLNTGWHHYAGVRSGNSLLLFIDGVLEASGSFSASIPNVTALPTVGVRASTGGSPWLGWIDEFRISVGVARWTSNFTPPAAPYGPK